MFVTATQMPTEMNMNKMCYICNIKKQLIFLIINITIADNILYLYLILNNICIINTIIVDNNCLQLLDNNMKKY